jgi:hypothetical protein
MATRRRRPRGTGRMERRGDRYRVRYRLPSGQEVTSTVDTREQAEALLVAMRSETYTADAAGAFDAPKELTLASWSATWMERRDQRVASPTKDHSVWRLYVEGTALLAMALRAIRTSHVVALVNVNYSCRSTTTISAGRDGG